MERDKPLSRQPCTSTHSLFVTPWAFRKNRQGVQPASRRRQDAGGTPAGPRGSTATPAWDPGLKPPRVGLLRVAEKATAAHLGRPPHPAPRWQLLPRHHRAPTGCSLPGRPLSPGQARLSYPCLQPALPCSPGLLPPCPCPGVPLLPLTPRPGWGRRGSPLHRAASAPQVLTAFLEHFFRFLLTFMPAPRPDSPLRSSSSTHSHAHTHTCTHRAGLGALSTHSSLSWENHTRPVTEAFCSCPAFLPGSLPQNE